MTYTRRWDCLACGNRTETVNYPSVLVCNRCIGRDPWVSYFRTQSASAAQMARLAESNFLDQYRTETPLA